MLKSARRPTDGRRLWLGKLDVFCLVDQRIGVANWHSWCRRFGFRADQPGKPDTSPCSSWSGPAPIPLAEQKNHCARCCVQWGNGCNLYLALILILTNSCADLCNWKTACSSHSRVHSQRPGQGQGFVHCAQRVLRCLQILAREPRHRPSKMRHLWLLVPGTHLERPV